MEETYNMSEPKVGSDNIDWNNHWSNVQTEITDAMVKELEWTFNSLPKGKFQILEVGCGPARYCRAWTEIGGEYFGIDFSDVAIEKAKILHPNNFFICANNYEVSIFGRMFDVIFTNTHLQHVANMNKNFLFEEFRKVLSQDGILILANEKDDVDSNTTMTYDKFKSFVEGHGFKLEAYAGTNKGYIFRKL